ncbi:MAG: tryptophan--tRNA ligase [Comamonadaceae bacterium]|nr:MAG: tryptophan--tRNA ligase [Comamonadaceae bacterium]
MSMQRFLTGITPSGTPHLGNYVGAIRPSVQASLRADVQNFYFLADYHALIKVDDPARIQRSTMEIAASWLASGLDPERVTFYRQSDIPEIAELTWLLTCVTSKGLLNRAHAYKAAVDQNTAAQQEPDAEISAGLFMYPVLMAADILMFKAHQVPVGRDQVQHIEMARDIAQRFNHLYGEHLTLPQALIEDNVATLPGLDGRKMSKSYDNHIPLFAPRQQLKKLVAGILTDSRAPGESKETEGSALFQIYQAFASAEETAALRQAYLDGIGWADAKQLLFERVDREMAPMRERYITLMAEPAKMEAILRAGAEKARKLATPFTAELRHAVGLRDLRAASASAKAAKTSKAALPSFKQYRESDAKFYFKLQESAGRVLLQSTGFATPQEAAKAIALLREQGALALGQPQETFVLQPGISEDDVLLALQQL